MKFTMLIYENPAEFALRDHPEKAPAYWASWAAYSQALVEAGVFAGGSGLLPPAAATTLRVQGDRRHVQDGPFAATKEQLGGYYVLDVPDLDAALEWAARCPALPNGALELRPNLPPMPEA